jgi:hypothetical protein
VTQSTSNSAPWYFNPSTLVQNPTNPDYQLVPAHKEDINRVATWYNMCPVPGMTLKMVEVIHNSQMARLFEGRVDLLQKRHGNPAFIPKWDKESQTTDQLSQRKDVIELVKTMSKPHTHKNTPNVSLLPLWHGTKKEILESIFTTGYANLATTDSGFFGKGLYNAGEAEYSYRVYAQGALIINWVAVYSVFPTIHGDMDKLKGKGNYQNYDGHFVPVYPKNPNNPHEAVYYPCTPQQKHVYTELVVFDPAQVLPRYLITLQPALPSSPQVLSTALDIDHLLTALLEYQLNLNEEDEAYLLIDQKIELYGGNNRPLNEKEIAVYNLAQRISGTEDQNQKKIYGKKISHFLKQMNQISSTSLISLIQDKPAPTQELLQTQQELKLLREQVEFLQKTALLVTPQVFSIEVKKVADLPAIAFGKAKWATYFGDVGVEPPLPCNIDQILKSPCPFFPNKTVGETHLLTLIPRTVDGELFTLNGLGELVKKPKQGSATKYGDYLNYIYSQYGDIPIPASYWVLFTNDVIPGTGGKSYNHQKQILADFSKKAKMPYEIPFLLEATTSILMEYVQNNAVLYRDTHTRCQEKYYEYPGSSLAIGGFRQKGLQIYYNNDGYNNEGIGASWQLS